MKYLGAKSLDAEIHIDFSTSEVTMDYSSNAFHSQYESNSSSRKDEENEWFNRPLWKKLLEISLQFIPECVSASVLVIAMPLNTTLAKYNLLPAFIHYPYQNFLRWHFATFIGTYEETFEGEMSGTILQVPVNKNIWCNYELSGDYEKYIDKIHFERRLRIFRKFGKYAMMRQDGWMLTFEFTQRPVSGSCKVMYV